MTRPSMPKLRVAMVSEHASPLAAIGGEDAGGQNVHVAALARELGALGNDVAIYTRRDDVRLPDRVPIAPGVVVHHVDAGPARSIPKDDLLPYMGDFEAHLRQDWRRSRPDVVHAHFWMSGMVAVEAASVADIPVVQTFHALGVVKRRHQGNRDTSPAERVAIEAQLLHRVDSVIATASDEVFELARMGADASRVKVIPCGVDLDQFCPDGPAEPRTAGSRRIVFVGRLVERKGIGNVISALANLPGTELIVAGGPPGGDLHFDPQARRLVRLARSLGVGEAVWLRGRVDRAELPALLRSADAVVCVPWYEPFGIVPLEAMACGVPVVVSAVGGLVDSVVDGVTGIHVPPRRPDDLACALRRLLADTDLRSRLGAAGGRRARARFGWPRVTRSTLDVYRDLCRSAAVPAMQGRQP